MKGKSRLSNRLSILVPIIVFIIGAGIFLYPAISNYISTIGHEDKIKTYNAKLSEASQNELDKLWEDAKIYNDNLAGDPLHDPFVVGSGYVIPENYNQVLNPDEDGVMCSIEIPSIDVKLPVYHGTSEEILAKGAGHIESTALPIGGVNRHSVISAHRGLPSALLFTRLDELEIGDVFNIHILNEVHSYEVNQIEVIKPEELKFLYPDKEKDLITLLTCTPYGVNTHRLLVRGHRIPYVPSKSIEPKKTIPRWIKEYISSIVLGIVILFIVIVVMRRKKNKR